MLTFYIKITEVISIKAFHDGAAMIGCQLIQRPVLWIDAQDLVRVAGKAIPLTGGPKIGAFINEFSPVLNRLGTGAEMYLSAPRSDLSP